MGWFSVSRNRDKNGDRMVKKQVKCKPNAKRQQLVVEADGSLTAHLKSPPVDGKANQELIALLAQHFGVPKSSITIKAGATGKLKLVEIHTEDD